MRRLLTNSRNPETTDFRVNETVVSAIPSLTAGPKSVQFSNRVEVVMVDAENEVDNNISKLSKIF